MEDIERLLKGTVEELDRLLNARNVLGDPIERNGMTVIPIVSYGFGFGAGGSSGSSGGSGSGGGIKPVGAIIIDADGARVEAIRSDRTTLAEVISDTVVQVMHKPSKGDSGSADGSAGKSTGKSAGKSASRSGSSTKA